jgi:dienelactone hydrolase
MTRSSWAAVVLYAVFTSPFAAAQTAERDTSTGDRWHATYFRQRVEAIEAACLKDIDTLEKWEARRNEDREALFDMLGLSPRPEKTGLHATVTGKVEREKFTVEKVHFQSRPQLYVTGNLYLPKNLDRPAPTILYLCGHGAVKKDGVSYGNKVTYQHHGIWFAEHGYVCFIIDSLQLGEIEGIHHGTHRENMWWWNALGYTPAGVEAWNCIRALDYLETRPEVDRQRMGATGRSGGGAYSWWIAALDDRIKAAAPVAGITDLRNHVIDGKVEGHCDCMYISNSHRWDYANVSALVAPRPLLIANSDNDNIFPLDGVLRVYEKTRAVYKLHNAVDKLGLLITPGPHKDTQELQMGVFKFLDKHLRGEERPIERAATKQLEPEELKVFDTLPTDQRNTTIHESFTRRFSTPAISTRDWKNTSTQWRELLREKVFPYWPAEPPSTSPPPRIVAVQKHEDIRLRVYEVDVHDHLALPLFHIEAIGRTAAKDVDLLVMNDDGWHELCLALAGKLDEPLAAYQPLTSDNRAPGELAFKELKRRLGQRDQFFFAPRNIGPTASNPATKAQTQLRRRYMLLGESLEGMQAWDVRRAIQAIRSIGDPSRTVPHVRGRGELAAAVLYGSLDRWRQPQLSLSAPPASHRAKAPFFHVLRYLDMPQAVALAVEGGHVELVDVEKDDWRFAIDIAKDFGWQERLTIITGVITGN